MKTTIKKLWRLGMLSLVGFNLLLAVAPVTLANGFGFTTIDVPGALFTAAFGNNPGGEIVGLYIDANDVGHGFLLSRGSFMTIDLPGAISTAAFGINPAGEIVGAYLDANGVVHGFLLSKKKRFGIADFGLRIDSIVGCRFTIDECILQIETITDRTLTTPRLS